MIRSIRQYIGKSPIACLALFLSLGMGSAYAAGEIGSIDIMDGGVMGVDLAPNAVTSDKIADHTIQNADINLGSIASDQIQEATIRGFNVAPHTLTSNHVDENSFLLDGDVFGTMQNLQIKQNSVDQLALVDGAVNDKKIADDAVKAAELATGAVNSLELADNAVKAPDIATAAVAGDEIATNAVNADEITTNAVAAAEIATDAVGVAEIAPDAIGPAEIGNLPAAIVCCAPSRSIPSGTPVTLEFPQLVTAPSPNTAGVHNAARPTRLTAPVAGIYQVQAHLYWTPDTTPSGFREIGIRCTGCEIAGRTLGNAFVAHERAPAHGQSSRGLVGDDSTGEVASASALIAMGPGDYVETLVFQDSGETQAIAGQDPLILSPSFSLTWVAPTS